MPKSLEIAFPGFHFQNFRGGPPQLFEVYNYDTVRFQSGPPLQLTPTPSTLGIKPSHYLVLTLFFEAFYIYPKHSRVYCL